MELYKVLECKDGKLISPYQYYEYIPGKKMICSDFDTNELKDCSRGYYATDIDGLIYTFRNLPDCEVWKVEVGGKKVEFNQFKRRYEEITLIEEIPHEEVKRLALEWEPKVGYKLAEALFPVNPLLISMNGDVTASEIELVRQWDVILGLVWALIGVPVGDSIGDLVGDWAGRHRRGPDPRGGRYWHKFPSPGRNNRPRIRLGQLCPGPG